VVRLSRNAGYWTGVFLILLLLAKGANRLNVGPQFVQDGNILRVTDLTGNVISELERTVDIEACAIRDWGRLLLFWGRQHESSIYGFYLAGLGTHQLSTVYEFPVKQDNSHPNVAASFAGDQELIRISVGFRTFLTQFDGAMVKEEPVPRWIEQVLVGFFTIRAAFPG
jgi:hypothetical protein